MDIVIPLGKGSRHQNMELRYVLRFIELFIPDRGQVFLIGDRPDFIHNVVYIPANDLPGPQHKERNIFQKVVMACLDKRVSDEFLYFNDDHFLISEWVPRDYFSGFLSDILLKRGASNYGKTIRNTLGILGEGKNFDCHCPMIFNKDQFMRSVARCPWHVAFGYCMKSLYGSLIGLEGTQKTDVKFRTPHLLQDLKRILGATPFFSVYDEAINQDMKDLLQFLFPEKSQYEK
jgi:hypothetical protein